MKDRTGNKALDSSSEDALRLTCLRQAEHMDELAGEIRGAMEAIGENDPQRFRDSVGRQRELAGALAPLPSLPPTPRDDAAEGPDWRERYARAASALRELNTEYAALIEHSGNSVKMLARLRGVAAGQAGTRWSVTA